METKINILNRIDSDIFGQFTGIYYGQESITVTAAGAYGTKINLTINSGDTIIVNSECVKNDLLLGPNKFQGIWSIYALNPKRGAIFTITKKME